MPERKIRSMPAPSADRKKAPTLYMLRTWCRKRATGRRNSAYGAAAEVARKGRRSMRTKRTKEDEHLRFAQEARGQPEAEVAVIYFESSPLTNFRSSRNTSVSSFWNI